MSDKITGKECEECGCNRWHKEYDWNEDDRLVPVLECNLCGARRPYNQRKAQTGGPKQTKALEAIRERFLWGGNPYKNANQKITDWEITEFENGSVQLFVKANRPGGGFYSEEGAILWIGARGAVTIKAILGWAGYGDRAETSAKLLKYGLPRGTKIKLN